MLIPLGILASAGAVVAPAMELIATTVLGTNTTSVSFTSLGDYSSTYKHLQIRMLTRFSLTDATQPFIRFNGDGNTNYSYHYLQGYNGTSMASGGGTTTALAYFGTTPGSSGPANAFAGHLVDILDVYSTTKNKTVRYLNGSQGLQSTTLTSIVELGSVNWRSTASVTSISISTTSGAFVTGSRFSLYGIKG